MDLEVDSVRRYDGEVGIVCLIRFVDLGDRGTRRERPRGRAVVFQSHD